MYVCVYVCAHVSGVKRVYKYCHMVHVHVHVHVHAHAFVCMLGGWSRINQCSSYTAIDNITLLMVPLLC